MGPLSLLAGLTCIWSLPCARLHSKNSTCNSFLLTMTLWVRFFHCAHFTAEETVAQRWYCKVIKLGTGGDDTACTLSDSTVLLYHYTYVFRKLINSLKKGEYIKERKSQRTLWLSFRKSRHIFLNGSWLLMLFLAVSLIHNVATVPDPTI